MSSSTVSTIIILFILIGSTFFREIFQWIWLGIGLLFFVGIIAFHTMESIQDRRNRRNKAKVPK